MDTRKLEALLTAVELGSFTRAAEVLGYTQSGLTHMMNSLEKDIGFTVLVRGRSGVQLTPAGQRLLPLVRDCLASTSALEREITLINTHKEDSVRVAAYESIARHWLPEIIRQFRREHPDVTVDIQMGSVEEVYRWVTEDRVDMCFASRQESPALEWTFLRDDELLAILPPDYDSAEDTFPIQFFTGQEFLMPSMGFDRDILRVLNQHGVTPLIRTTQVSDSAVISMVEHGLGVSVLSRLVLRGRQNSVRALPLAPRAVRELGIAARPKKELRPIVRRFIQQSCEMIEKM